ncbi:MAG: hypothetical protein HKP61_23570 [Dactylosporangium sp.]|nr:hypothetical protein [Dactylosporangium sp.]NNJ63859.1 hypothetical protein [Dactylosporangium sp.]
MRWVRLGLGRRRVHRDPARQQTLLHEARNRFGPQWRVPFSDQNDAVVRLLDGDDGLLVAVDIVREFADAAHAELVAQATDLRRRTGQDLAVHRRNYRPLWRAAEGRLRWTLFTLPPGFFPYVHVTAAVTVIGSRARRAVQVTGPEPLLAHLFEILDLIIAGWEYGRVRVDTDAVALAHRLISTAQQLRAAMATPPPLPPPVRELMRRNSSIDVHDSAGDRVVGAFDPGQQMRESLLV